jgi:hypothetical protein
MVMDTFSIIKSCANKYIWILTATTIASIYEPVKNDNVKTQAIRRLYKIVQTLKQQNISSISLILIRKESFLIKGNGHEENEHYFSMSQVTGML